METIDSDEEGQKFYQKRKESYLQAPYENLTLNTSIEWILGGRLWRTLHRKFRLRRAL